jgi:hypothetical protein
MRVLPNSATPLEFARGVVRKFQGTGTSLQEGLGIRVELRSVPYKNTKVPREIPTNDSGKAIIVPLVDSAMVNDRNWNSWIAKFVNAKEFFDVLPVVFSKDAKGWDVIKGPNPVYLFETEVEQRMDMLNRQLLIFCLGRLSATGATATTPNPRLVISYHGESDGKAIGDKIHKCVGDEFRGLNAFLAHKDLPPGADLATGLKETVEQSAAMISVFTEDYESRPWCRREVRWARTPSSAGAERCWKMTPLVVVEALRRKCSVVLSEFAGCQLIPWDDELAIEVVDRALMEAVINAYHRRWSERYVGDNRVVINWIPDALSLLKLRAAGGLPSGYKLIYPGHGITATDQVLLRELFGDVQFLKYTEVTDT